MISGIIILSFFLPILPANADDTAVGLKTCNAAYQACEKDRADQEDILHVERQTNKALENRIATCDEKQAAQAASVPGYLWGLGGGAATVVLLAVLGLLKGR